MRIATVLVLVLTGCDSEEPMQADAGPDIDAPDARPGIDFFGEPCPLPTYTAAVTFCRDNYAGYCVDEGNGDLVGVCRPRCDVLHPNWNAEYVCTGSKDGGVPTWTSDGMTPGKPYVCYCAPPT